MSDSNPIPPPAVKAPLPRASREVTARDTGARVVGAAALVAIAVVGWLAWDARQAVQTMESTAGGRLAELGAAAALARSSLSPSQASLKDAQALRQEAPS